MLLIINNSTAKSKNIALNKKINCNSKIFYLQGHYILKYLKNYLFKDLAISFQKISVFCYTFKEIYSKSNCQIVNTKIQD